MDYKKRERERELEKKAFLSPLQAAVSWAVEPQAMPKKLHSQPHRGQLQSLCAVSSCSQKTRAFLDVLSDLYQADASHKVPHRSGNTYLCWIQFLQVRLGYRLFLSMLPFRVWRYQKEVNREVIDFYSNLRWDMIQDKQTAGQAFSVQISLMCETCRRINKYRFHVSRISI